MLLAMLILSDSSLFVACNEYTCKNNYPYDFIWVKGMPNVTTFPPRAFICQPGVRVSIRVWHRHCNLNWHDDVIKWKHYPRHWTFLWGIQRSPMNSPHKGQWLGALMFSLICAWINIWVNNREADDLKSHGTYYDVIVMYHYFYVKCQCQHNNIETKWHVSRRRFQMHFTERKILYLDCHCNWFLRIQSTISHHWFR